MATQNPLLLLQQAEELVRFAREQVIERYCTPDDHFEVTLTFEQAEQMYQWLEGDGGPEYWSGSEAAFLGPIQAQLSEWRKTEAPI